MRRRLALRLRVPDLYPPEDEAHGGAREVDRLRRGRDREAVCVQRASVCVVGQKKHRLAALSESALSFLKLADSYVSYSLCSLKVPGTIIIETEIIGAQIEATSSEKITRVLSPLQDHAF
ncbi:unnamed protein product [Brassica napus]|uniref:(rape) hypothetical protein n=1 Tax=Brassica napus TaxID=3708 RepID=A0A816P351_BRANA|nr:unnamed protein product [Brassica napus]